MIDLLADFSVEGFGDAVSLDHKRALASNGLRFLHLFEDYYVFQYATGISAAHALALAYSAKHLPQCLSRHAGNRQRFQSIRSTP